MNFAAKDAGEFRRQKQLFQYAISVHRELPPFQLRSRVLGAIRDKLQELSKRFAVGNSTEKEGDLNDACGLVNDLSDAIVEYQVGADTENEFPAVHLRSSIIVLSTESDL